MALIQNIIFDGGEVQVDGNTYEGCKFKNCTIVYRGGQRPVYARCRMDSISFQLADAADNTIGFINDLYHNGFQKDVEQLFTMIRTS